MLKSLMAPFRYPKTDGESVRKQKQRPQNIWKTAYQLWVQLQTYRIRLFMVIFLVVIGVIFSVLAPFLIGYIIDHYIVEGKTSNWIFVLSGLAAIYFFSSVLGWVENVVMIQIAQKTVGTLRRDIMATFHTLPISFFNQRQQGELMSRVTNDIENVSSTLNSSIINITSSIVTLVGTIVMMFILSIPLSFVTISTIPLLYYGMKWITTRTGRLYREQQRSIGAMNGFIEETLSNQKIVKAFAQEEKLVQQFQTRNAQFRDVSFWSQTYAGFIPKLMNVLNNLNFTFIVAIGSLFVLKDWVTIGIVITFTEYARQFTRPLNDLANQYNTLLSAVAGAERVFRIIEEPTRDDEGEQSLPTSLKGDVLFNNVSFFYESTKQILHDVSFEAKAGTMTAFIGETGAGKTTLLQLLPQFYKQQSGTITLDEHDVTKLKKRELRKEIGFILQDTYIVPGTVYENIVYGNPHVTKKQVILATKAIGLHELICRLPEGYQTYLHREATFFSQGQKQLLSIARILIMNPKILILDEATSSMDTVTEGTVQKALHYVMKQRTTFVIAHRLSTIRHADQIIVLQNGRIIERGTHKQLLEREGAYYTMQHRNRQNRIFSSFKES